ncbi:hypothetical protein R1sor_021465 [Riccia sorocarpa]|uniref:Uncharacterized protein n=1 Tax=Riccia sorocarpa TaxID=122646 RepID=A0ABD3GJA4_9MARC
MNGKSSEAEVPTPFKLQVKVVRSRKSKSVLYLECGKDLVNILLRVLTKPLRELLKLLSDAGLSSEMKNGVFNLYANCSTMDTSTLSVDKRVLLGPSDVSFQNYFVLEYPRCRRRGCPNLCQNSCSYFCRDCQEAKICKCLNCGMKGKSPRSSETCVHCGHKFKKSQTFEYKTEAKPGRCSTVSSYNQCVQNPTTRGYVRGNVVYMVKEDLSISRSEALNNLVLQQVENFGELEAKEISVGEKEVLLLVRATLSSKTPLTDVFGPLV